MSDDKPFDPEAHPGVIDARFGLPEPTAPPPPPEPVRRTSRRQLVAAAGAGAVLSLAAVVGVAFTGQQSSANAAVGAVGSTTSVAQDRPPRPVDGVAGKVTGISGTTLTVQATRPLRGPGRGCAPDSDGEAEAPASGADSAKPTTFTVTTGSSTKFAEFSTGKVADLAAGDKVAVMGRSTGDSVAARHIVKSDADAPDASERHGAPPGDAQGNSPQRRPHKPVVGTIAAVNGATLTLKTSTGETMSVTTTASTEVTVVQAASLSDIEVGDHVRARGSVSGTTVAAESVRIGTPPRGPRPGRGDQAPPTTN